MKLPVSKSIPLAIFLFFIIFFVNFLLLFFWFTRDASPWVWGVNQYQLIAALQNSRSPPSQPGNGPKPANSASFRGKKFSASFRAKKFSKKKRYQLKRCKQHLQACNCYWWLQQFFSIQYFLLSHLIFSPCYQFYEARFDPSLNGSDLTRFLVETFSPHIFPPDARF